MLDIKVYGTGTSAHLMVYDVVQDILNRANIEYHIEDITDVLKVIESGVKAIPSVQIGIQDPIVISTTDSKFSQSLRELVQNILSASDYGDLKQIVLPFEVNDKYLGTYYYSYRLATEMQSVLKVVNIDEEHENDFFSVSCLIKQKKAALDEFLGNINTDWGSDMLQNALIDTSVILGTFKNGIKQVLNNRNVQFAVFCSDDKFLDTFLLDPDCAYFPCLVINNDLGFKGYQHVFYVSEVTRYEFENHQLICSLKGIFNICPSNITCINFAIRKEIEYFLSCPNAKTLLVMSKKEWKVWNWRICMEASMNIGQEYNFPVLLIG